MRTIPPHDPAAILAARHDLADLQRRVREREAFPQSRGMTALDAVLQRCVDGPRRAERAIGGALGIGLTLVWLGWLLGRR